ncbi:MAG TPA: MarR family winged helix-turn-helix transcriptional regulator, partial [Rhodocyclaceae bacterium]|nr:MarR family winged helix-turn-helix transcriptional regulator [Rhodocyclaceae bacterium]
PQARIAELIGAAGYVVSRNVDRLETAGYVERKADPANRRVRRVFLTPAGRQLQAELMPIALAANEKALESLDPDECCVLKRLLKKSSPNCDGGQCAGRTIPDMRS